MDRQITTASKWKSFLKQSSILLFLDDEARHHRRIYIHPLRCIHPTIRQQVDCYIIVVVCLFENQHMMKLFSSLVLAFGWGASCTRAFLPAPRTTTCVGNGVQRPSTTTSSSSLSATNKLEAGDPVMLVGPGFLQLVLAKHLKRAGLKPIIVAPQKKLDSFFANLVLDSDLKADATIGLPETGDPYFGELKGVVFCAEDAILPSEFVTRVLDFTHEGKSVWADGAPARAICALPVGDKVQKEKSNSWIPIFNNDRTIEQTWRNFEEKFKGHAVFKSEGGVGSIIRFGSLFGGSSDGPPFLKEENLALEEGMYKMSLEQYRDLRERGFDRHRLGAQVLAGNAINPKPPNQEKMEKEGLKKWPGEIQEAFGIFGAYPEIDRANRHTVASAITAALLKPADAEGMPKEMTILSKAEQQLPDSEEWYSMFADPGPASWPDPFTFRPEALGLEVENKAA